jgi:hypothetical protein
MGKPNQNFKYMEAVTLLREGYSRKAVADIMGVSVWNVGSYARCARKKGISYMPDVELAIVKHLPPNVASWLRKQVPEGATVGDVLRAIVIDTYNDEMEDKE